MPDDANVQMTVRQVTAHTAVIDIKGDVSAFAEPILMQAYSQANTPTTRTFILNFSGLEIHEQQRHRPARHPAHSHQPATPALAGLWAKRPLSAHLHAHPSQRGYRTTC